MLNIEYYMSKSVSHAVPTREPYITPRTTGPRGDIGRGLIRHVIQILTCNVHYIIYFNHAFDNTFVHLFYEKFEFFRKFLKFLEFKKKKKIEKFYANFEFF